MNIYLRLTKEFNAGKLRAVITSGQAVVLHRLAIMSKDGDWILREDEESLKFVLNVLAKHGARYRFGAPLDLRWMREGWSAHLEFPDNGLRVRTDFFTRPPRISENDLAEMWKEQEGKDPALINVRLLIEMKKTNREKDYVVIGELARLLKEPRDQMLHSRSARDLISLAEKNPSLMAELVTKRPLLSTISQGKKFLEAALDQERREFIDANEQRLAAYEKSAAAWRNLWPKISAEIAGKPLLEANEILTARAVNILPFSL